MTTTGKNPAPAVSCGREHPTRAAQTIEHELYPVGASWLDLMPPNADASTRLVFSCLEHGALEAWQDTQGTIRLYLPQSLGGHLIVGGPGDDLEPIDLQAPGPGHNDHRAMVRRPGAARITLLPGIRRARTRPQPTAGATRPATGEVDRDT